MENAVEGIAIIVDDELQCENGGSKIEQLVSELEEQHIPCVKYREPPSHEVAQHFHGIAFVILDWKFLPESLTNTERLAGVTLPSSVAVQGQKQVIDFIKLIKDQCFAPIFLLTNENLDIVTAALQDAGIDVTSEPNFIHIKSKSDIEHEQLIQHINSWVEGSPSIYVLNEWQKHYFRAKADLFGDMYNLSPHWPAVLHETYNKDGIDPAEGIQSTLSANLRSRMLPFVLNTKLLQRKEPSTPPEETRKVLSGERFIEEGRFNSESIAPGDIFKKKQKYYVNIRPECDSIPRNGEALDDVNIYLLSTDKISDDELEKEYRAKYGNLPENDTQTVVPFIRSDLSLRIKFKDLKVVPWKDWKENRIGRLIPPYVTRVQQRYSHYLQRQALPRIPEVAVRKADQDEAS